MRNAAVFKELVPVLVEAIPRAVKAEDFAEPVYCLRVYYDSIDTPEEGYATRLRLIKKASRARVLASKGRNAPYYLWCADETDCLEQGPNICLDDYPEISELCLQIYERLCD